MVENISIHHGELALKTESKFFCTWKWRLLVFRVKFKHVTKIWNKIFLFNTNSDQHKVYLFEIYFIGLPHKSLKSFFERLFTFAFKCFIPDFHGNKIGGGAVWVWMWVCNMTAIWQWSWTHLKSIKLKQPFANVFQNKCS